MEPNPSWLGCKRQGHNSSTKLPVRSWRKGFIDWCVNVASLKARGGRPERPPFLRLQVSEQASFPNPCSKKEVNK
jgi:hypothetical protein